MKILWIDLQDWYSLLIGFCFCRYNDNPNGLFGIVPDYQTVVVDTADLSRSVQLNFTRYEGKFGTVILTFAIKYDIVSSFFIL